jgi:anti-sigma B factor antagonist
VSSAPLIVGPLAAGHIPLMLSGEIDLANAQLVVERATKCLYRDDVDALSLDLGDVTFMDSTGLSAMITLLNLAGETGKALTLRRVPDRVRRLLELTGLNRIFTIELDGPDGPAAP